MHTGGDGSNSAVAVVVPGTGGVVVTVNSGASGWGRFHDAVLPMVRRLVGKYLAEGAEGQDFRKM